MSQDTAPDAEGELQGLIARVSALAMILSPLIVTNFLAAFTAERAALSRPVAPVIASLILVSLGGLLFAGHARGALTRIDA